MRQTDSRKSETINGLKSKEGKDNVYEIMWHKHIKQRQIGRKCGDTEGLLDDYLLICNSIMCLW